MMGSYSIARRLIVTVLLIELASALCVTTVAWVYERHTHFRSFDVMLRGRADSLIGAVGDSGDVSDNVVLDGSEASLPPDDLYEVIEGGTRVLGHSAGWTVSGNELHAEGNRNDRARGGSADPQESFFSLRFNDKKYRVIRVSGMRVVDPGEKNGGVRRYVTVYYGSTVESVWNAVNKVVSFYALSSLIVLAITGIVMSWLLNRGLAPLRSLAAGAARISVKSWDFSPPESARASKELAPLVVAMEELLDGLKSSFERQRRFAGDAAHELKTSVAVVKSSVQLLQMKSRSAEDYEAGLERCLYDCERMEEVVAQMLTLARIEERGGNEFVRYEAEVSSCVRAVYEQLSPMAELNGIALKLEIVEPSIVAISAELVKLLCQNLIMNALQHSPSGSTISTQIGREGAMAVISIRDEGHGIPPENMPFIFERFSRSDPSRSRKTGGTGLGLAICKGIVDGCRGTIEVESVLDHGTTVVVRIPILESLPANLDLDSGRTVSDAPSPLSRV